MANTVLATLRDTIKAFNLRDEALARHVLKSDDVVDALYHQIVQDMICLMETDGQKANAEWQHHDRQEPGVHRRPLHQHRRGRRHIHTGRIIRHLHAV